MYTIKEVCLKLDIPYETLKFYCKEGLVPNVKRDKNNYRVFDEQNIAWIRGLQCLRKCGMSIKDMKDYMNLCLEGKSSVPQRKIMLENTRQNIEQRIAELQESLQYIDDKQAYYDDVLEGKIELTSYITEL